MFYYVIVQFHDGLYDVFSLMYESRSVVLAEFNGSHVKMKGWVFIITLKFDILVPQYPRIPGILIMIISDRNLPLTRLQESHLTWKREDLFETIVTIICYFLSTSLLMHYVFFFFSFFFFCMRLL